MTKRYVLAISGTGHSFVLGLDHRTKAEAEQCIRWMHVGQFNMDYVITTYDHEMDYFVDEAGNSWRPGADVYVASAWEKFKARIQPKKKELS